MMEAQKWKNCLMEQKKVTLWKSKKKKKTNAHIHAIVFHTSIRSL